MVLFFVSSCDNEKKEEIKAPDNLISKEKMIIIMADIQVTEAYIKKHKLKRQPKTDTSLLYFHKLFQKNEVTKGQFENSLLYYKENLPELQEMYTRVITRLNQLKAKNEEILIQMKTDSIIQDSILKAEHVLDSINSIKDTIFAPE